MNSNMFADAFIEGVCVSNDVPDFRKVAYQLAKMVYDARTETRTKIQALKDQIAVMDDVARENLSTVKCRGCDEYYDIPCELSEFHPDMSYCGGSPRCCP